MAHRPWTDSENALLATLRQQNPTITNTALSKLFTAQQGQNAEGKVRSGTAVEKHIRAKGLGLSPPGPPRKRTTPTRPSQSTSKAKMEVGAAQIGEASSEGAAGATAESDVDELDDEGEQSASYFFPHTPNRSGTATPRRSPASSQHTRTSPSQPNESPGPSSKTLAQEQLLADTRKLVEMQTALVETQRRILAGENV